MLIIKYLVSGFLAVALVVLGIMFFRAQVEDLYKVNALLMIWMSLSSFANYYITEKLKIYLKFAIILFAGACLYFVYNHFGGAAFS